MYNLDVRNQYKVLKKVNQFSKGKNSAIVVLHDLNLAARYADKILLMKNGEVMSYGKPNEVFQQQIISDAYDFPCAICKHPITSDPRSEEHTSELQSRGHLVCRL